MTRVEDAFMSPIALLHRSALLAVFLVPPVVSSSLCAPVGAAERGTIRIGLLAASTGVDQDQGSDIVAGFQYFLASHGDRLGGFNVEIRTGDEGSSVEAALAIAHRLIESERVDTIVGIVSSANAYGIADYLDEQKIPLVIAGAGADELTQGKARKTFFRVSHTSSQDVMPLGEYVCRKTRYKRIALIAADIPYAIEAVGGFARTYADAGCKIAQEQYAPAGGDWSVPIGKIDRKVDAVFAAAGNGDSINFIRAFKAILPGMPLYGDSTLTNPRVVRAVGEKSVGIVSGSHYSSTAASKVNAAFQSGYESISGAPMTYFVENGYVAAQALSEALAHVPAGTIHSEDLERALRAVNFSAPRGNVFFDGDQQMVDDVYVRKIRQIGGKYRNDVIYTYPGVTQYWRYDRAKYLQFPTYAKLKGTWVKS